MWQPSPLFQLIALSLAAHIALAGSRVTTSLYALSLNASQLTVGALAALFSIFPMIFAVPMGRLIDRIGITRPMGAGCFSICIGCTLPMLVDGLSILYLATAMIGTGFMTVQIASQHAVGAMSIDETRSVNFSMLALGYSISGFCGPVIAGFLIDHTRHAVTYLVLGSFALTTLILLSFSSLGQIQLSHHEEVQRTGGTIGLLRNVELRRLFLIGILLSAAWDLFVFVMPIYGASLKFSASTIGLILGCFASATFMVRLFMPWISRHCCEWRVLAAALGVAVLCYLLFPFMHQPLSIMTVAAVLGLAVGSSQPNMLALLHRTAPRGRTGEVVGMRVTVGNACQVIFPLAFGAAGAALGLFSVFWGMGALIASGLPLALRKAFAKKMAADIRIK